MRELPVDPGPILSRAASLANRIQDLETVARWTDGSQRTTLEGQIAGLRNRREATIASLFSRH